MGVQSYVAAALPPGMTRYPLHRRLGGHSVSLDGRNCYSFLGKFR